MIIKKSKAYTTLSIDPKNVNKKSQLTPNFYKHFIQKYTTFKNDNLILDFSKNINIELEEILLFSQKSGEHKDNNKSFVIVYNGVGIDDVEMNLVVVPTFKEAEDIIEIEEIERDLGI